MPYFDVGPIVFILGAIFLLIYGAIAYAVIGVICSFFSEKKSLIKGRVRIVLWIFAIALPAAYPKVDKEIANYKRNEKLSGCSDATVRVTNNAESDHYFIDRRYLAMLFAQSGGGGGFPAISQFMVSKNLKTLETNFWKNGLFSTDLSDMFGNSRFPFMKNSDDYYPYIRFTLAKSGGDVCKPFFRWANKYPEQNYPALRKAGLELGSCIAIEFIDRPTATYQVIVSEKNIEPSESRGSWHRYSVDVIDTTKPPASTLANFQEDFVINFWGNPFFPCGKGRSNTEGGQRVKDFSENIRSTATIGLRSMAITPIETISIAAEKAIPRKLFDLFDWTEQYRQRSAFDAEDERGVAWTENPYETRVAGRPGVMVSWKEYALNVVSGSEILQFPVQIPGKRVIEAGKVFSYKHMHALPAYVYRPNSERVPYLFIRDCPLELTEQAELGYCTHWR